MGRERPEGGAVHGDPSSIKECTVASRGINPEQSNSLVRTGSERR
jgi:hypothetical protein